MMVVAMPRERPCATSSRKPGSSAIAKSQARTTRNEKCRATSNSHSDRRSAPAIANTMTAERRTEALLNDVIVRVRGVTASADEEGES